MRVFICPKCSIRIELNQPQGKPRKPGHYFGKCPQCGFTIHFSRSLEVSTDMKPLPLD